MKSLQPQPAESSVTVARKAVALQVWVQVPAHLTIFQRRLAVGRLTLNQESWVRILALEPNIVVALWRR